MNMKLNRIILLPLVITIIYFGNKSYAIEYIDNISIPYSNYVRDKMIYVGQHNYWIVNIRDVINGRKKIIEHPDLNESFIYSMVDGSIYSVLDRNLLAYRILNNLEIELFQTIPLFFNRASLIVSDNIAIRFTSSNSNRFIGLYDRMDNGILVFLSEIKINIIDYEPIYLSEEYLIGTGSFEWNYDDQFEVIDATNYLYIDSVSGNSIEPMHELSFNYPASSDGIGSRIGPITKYNNGFVMISHTTGLANIFKIRPTNSTSQIIQEIPEFWNPNDLVIIQNVEKQEPDIIVPNLSSLYAIEFVNQNLYNPPILSFNVVATYNEFIILGMSNLVIIVKLVNDELELIDSIELDGGARDLNVWENYLIVDHNSILKIYDLTSLQSDIPNWQVYE